MDLQSRIEKSIANIPLFELKDDKRSNYQAVKEYRSDISPNDDISPKDLVEVSGSEKELSTLAKISLVYFKAPKSYSEESSIMLVSVHYSAEENIENQNSLVSEGILSKDFCIVYDPLKKMGDCVPVVGFYNGLGLTSEDNELFWASEKARVIGAPILKVPQDILIQTASTAYNLSSDIMALSRNLEERTSSVKESRVKAKGYAKYLGRDQNFIKFSVRMTINLPFLL